MARHNYYVKGFECDSCVKVMAKVVSQFPGASIVESDSRKGSIVLECEDSDEKEIVNAVKEKGYLLSPTPLESNTIERNAFASAKHYLSGIANGSKGFETERMLLENTLLSFFLIIGMEILVSIAFSVPAEQYKWLLLLTAIAVSANAFAVWHSIAYRKEFTCMGGMMVGMILGMMGGFMVGAVVSASNGMFVGSVIGMAVGMAIGAYCGYCCGIMGWLEGLLAGIMGGIMGAMTSIMLLNDHLLEFLFILFGACTIVLGGLSYMIYKEAGSEAEKARLPSGLTIVLLNVGVALAIVLIMVLGPKGPLAWVGFRS